MAKYILLLQLQIKAAFKSLPKLIAATILFATLVGLVGFCGTKLLDNNHKNKRMDIALVLPPDADSYTTLAFSFLSDIDTVKNMCAFETIDREDAFEGLRNRSISAVILIPDNFVNHIMDGTNTPANIILPRSGVTSESMLFRTFVNAGVADLAAAQAGIYAVDDVCRYYTIEDGISQSEDFLNPEYLSYALNRTECFKTETITSTGSLTTIEFYICSGIVLFLLLSGISCSDLLKRENRTLSLALKRRRIPVFLLFAFKILSVALVFFSIFLFTYFMTSLAQIRFPAISKVLPHLNLISLLSLFFLMIGIFAMVHCIFQFAQTQSLGVLLLFTISTLMLFISGGFVPLSLLPEALQTISVFLPTTYFIRLCGEIVTNGTTLLTFLINAGFAVFFIGCSTGSDLLNRNQS